MNRYIKLSTALLFLFSSSYFAQDDIIEMTTKKPKVTYRFDGVSFESMSLKEIKPKGVKASSTLASKTNAYKADYLTDHNAKTAWVEGQDDNGVGASVTFLFEDQNSYPDVIEVFPGYGKDDKTWTANVRPVALKVQLLDESMNEKEPIEYFTMAFQLENGKVPMKSQFIDITNMHLHNMALTEFKYLKIEVLSIDDEGAKYKDMCISTVNFYQGDKVLKRYSAEEYSKLKE